MDEWDVGLDDAHRQARDAYVASIDEVYGKKARALNRQLQDIDQELLQIRDQAQALARRRQDYMRLYGVQGPDRELKLKADFEAILACPETRSVRVVDGWLEVETWCLFARERWSGAWHEVGELLIRIPIGPCDQCGLPSGADEWTIASMATIRNLTNKVKRRYDRFDAPHVCDGRICYGNLIKMAVECIAREDWPRFLRGIYEFVRNADAEDDWGASVTGFPFVTDDPDWEPVYPGKPAERERVASLTRATRAMRTARTAAARERTEEERVAERTEQEV